MNPGPDTTTAPCGHVGERERYMVANGDLVFCARCHRAFGLVGLEA